ncbi:ATPase family protein 2 homolog isoform X2 [Stegodyphus dumicola]|uniref:ATPase family protein 2 homolog isoform X2 n=1 Tax=Stegodyphus dumicola TaxID=202533 RepID=UPI0015B165C4|nr:ATPase family protein 2 homolog isoform X2 [Stegodyphus dumicola]
MHNAIEVWKQCIHCNILVSFQDFGIHQQICGGATNSNSTSHLPHGYIWKGVFYATTHELDENENILLPSFRNTLLLMHPSTMKIMNFIKGDSVLLCTKNGQIILKCWPCVEVQASSVFIPAAFLFHCSVKSHFAIIPYTDYINVAVNVTCSLHNPQAYLKSQKVKDFIKKELAHIYITEGMNLNFRFLGYPFSITIDAIESSAISSENMKAPERKKSKKTLDDICMRLKYLNLNESNSSSVEDSINESHSTSFSALSRKSFQCSTPKSSKPGVLNKSSVAEHFRSVSNVDKCSVLVSQYFSINKHTNFHVDLKKCNEYETFSSSTKFENLHGLEKQISEIKVCINSIIHANPEEHVRGLLLLGPSGTGKSSVAEAIQMEYKIPIFVIKHSSEGGFKSKLRKIFSQAAKECPCLLFIDDIDSLLFDQSVLSQNEDVAYNELCAMLSNFLILIDIIGRSKHDLSPEEILKLSHLTRGFTGQDLKRLYSEVQEFAWERRNITSSIVPSLNFMDFKESLKHIKPISVAEFNFEIPDVKWTDIGGMHDVKNAVTEMIDWPLRFAEQFKQFKIVPCRGILMYGPPGCSKTMIAKALASEGHLNFIPIKGPQIFNKYVGESEKCVSELFKKARSAAPCVIFFDEIDSISSVRGSTSGSSNVADRVLIQLLIEIDGIDVLQGVSIIAATNRPDIIDPSLLRRFDQLYVPLPDDATRKEIIDAKLKKMPLSSDVDISYLVKATENYSGAEIFTI